MPPRIPSLSLGAHLCFRPKPSFVQSPHLPLTTVVNASTKSKRKHVDPYRLAQSKQRKAANVRRQEELGRQRAQALGDPIRGVPTPFVENLDDPQKLNHYLDPWELERSLEHSHILTQPLIDEKNINSDPVQEAQDLKRHEEAHQRASEAVQRVVALVNGNSGNRTKANIRTCIDTFGRHNTDKVLKPRAPSQVPRGPDAHPLMEKTPRAGPDTGSSEVQIAILTAKIRVLADSTERWGHKDKINKRNLRVLVHRRQKLLRYLHKKERGSERWQNLISTLGLTEGTWKGEISL